MKTDAQSFIEPLEPRVAPASVLTFTDVDGDKVKITSSVGDLNAPGVATFDAGGHQLLALTLTDPSFQGASIATSVAKSATGDGLVNIGRINAEGRDLGTVKISGDLGSIRSGDATTSTPGLKLLDVRSMGIYGSAFPSGADLFSSVLGRLGSLIVHGDMNGATISVGGVFTPKDGSIGAVQIGGSLIGTSATDSGLILSTGDMGPVKIGGNVIGGDGDESGLISCSGRLASLSIGGSLVGGQGRGSGQVETGSLGAAKVGGDVHGGLGGASGSILSRGAMASVSIGRSLIGGGGNQSGDIRADGDLGTVKIGGDLTGGSIGGATPTLDASGCIQGDRIGSVVIGGSVIAGSDNSTAGSLTRNASIRSANDLGSLTVKGSLLGTSGPNGVTAVQILAVGQRVPARGVDLAIGKISIGGQVVGAEILAGYGIESEPENGNASIGSVSVRGDWAASSIAAGVLRPPGGFGTGGAVINNGGDAIIARIASITIGGVVAGTATAGDHFGFTAQEIGSFKSLGFVAKLRPGPFIPDRIELSPTTGDVTIFEV